MGNVKVLKFGGTSVGSVDSLKSVVKIVQQANQNSTVIAVVSALGGITNQLVSSSDLALKGDDSYKNILLEIENRHFDVIRQLIDINEQSSLIATIKVLLNQLEDILIGVSLVQELSPKTSDFILSFGELLSSVIIYKLLILRYSSRLYDLTRKVKESLQYYVITFLFLCTWLPLSIAEFIKCRRLYYFGKKRNKNRSQRKNFRDWITFRKH